MTKFVRYDPSITDRPSPVTSLYDADVINYPNFPSPDELLVVDDDTWKTLPAPWAVQNGVLITYTPPPPPPPPPTPMQILVEKIATGIAITSDSAPELNATYAMDSKTMDQIGSVARDVGANLGLPGGGSAFVYPDITGQPHSFTEAQLKACYQAMRDLLWKLNTQAAIMQQGGIPTWPVQSAKIP